MYSILNLLGLTIGLSCSILLFIDVNYNLSFDKFNKNYHNIYSVNSWTPSGKGYTNKTSSALVGPMLKEQIPEIEDFSRIVNTQFIFKTADKTFLENGVYADQNFLTIFSFPLKKGEVKSVLSDQKSIVISERMAQKFFDNNDCIGKELILKDKNTLESFQVAGILKDVPTQSTLKFDFIIPFTKFLANNSWANKINEPSCYNWLLLKPNADYRAINIKIDKVINSNDPIKRNHFLISLKDEHLFNYIYGKRGPVGAILDVIIFSSVAILLLLIACFNFMNLAIAVTVKRYGEAGIKKAVGSSRKNIIFQFLLESLILTFISTALALLLVKFLLPAYNSFSPLNKGLTIPFSNFPLMAGFAGIILITAFISGIYPAILLSSVSTIDVLKRNISVKSGMNYFRQGLIVFQFFISVVFITITIVVWKQADYVNTKELGLNKDNLLIFENHENIRKHQTTFKSELLSLKEVSSVCYSNSKPFEGIKGDASVDWPGKEVKDNRYFQLINTDYDFMKTLEPDLLYGRFFDEKLATDTKNFVINQSSADLFKQINPVGEVITVNGSNGTIIGVVKNFHTSSLLAPYSPVIIKINPQSTYYTVVKFLSGNKKALIESIRSKYKQFDNDYPFEPQFVSDNYIRQNVKNQVAVLTGIFAAIAIFLACFGLFGLASFNAEKRTKEIGVRKINGSTIFNIILLLLRNYARWITIAICIGVPVAFLLGKAFLGIFAFHVEIPYWAFIFGPLIVMIIALSTVGWRTFKAATRNPVEALRYE
jgi:ABC-type antimicrobial peptide transport system permease subunit